MSECISEIILIERKANILWFDFFAVSHNTMCIFFLLFLNIYNNVSLLMKLICYLDVLFLSEITI